MEPPERFADVLDLASMRSACAVDGVGALDWSDDALGEAARSRRPTLLRMESTSSPVASWPAWTSWTPRGLTSAPYASLPVVAQVGDSPIFGYEAGESEGASHLVAGKRQTAVHGWETTLGSFALAASGGSQHMYLSAPLRNFGDTMLPGVRGYEQLGVPDPNASDEGPLVSVWAGSVNATTQAHYDLDHNVCVCTRPCISHVAYSALLANLHPHPGRGADLWSQALRPLATEVDTPSVHTRFPPHSPPHLAGAAPARDRRCLVAAATLAQGARRMPLCVICSGGGFGCGATCGRGNLCAPPVDAPRHLPRQWVSQP